MFDLDGWQEILSTLRSNVLRTVLTAVGVFWGVFMLIAMVGFGNGLQSGVHKEMGGLAEKSVFVWGDRMTLPYAGIQPGKWIEITRADGTALESQIPDIDVVAPRASLNGRGQGDVVTRGDKSGAFSIMGDVPSYLRIQPEVITSGRFIDQLDIDRHRKVAVIGNRVAEILFPPGKEPVGESIRIRGMDFLVVGVFHTEIVGDRGDRFANTIHTPLSTFQQVLNPVPWVTNLAVLVRPNGDTDAVDHRIHEILARRHRVSVDDTEAIGTWNAEKEFQKTENLFKGISLLIWIVGTVTLIAGIVGVSNIMMISVRERTRELGIRRAIGATPWSVVAQVLKESMSLTAFAGYLGLVAGVGILEVVSSFMRSMGKGAPRMFDPPHADLRVAIAATIAVMVGGALAGLFPALHAVRVRPVVALRDE